MTVALIAMSPYGIVATYSSPPNPLLLPSGAKVYGAVVGWTDGAHALVNVTPFTASAGQEITGDPTYSIDGSGNVTETYSTIPIPPQVIAAAALAAGLAITSTGTPALNATYATDTEARDEIASIELYIAEYGTFPGGATSLAYPDITGTMHTFPTVGAFAPFAKAIADYVAAVIETANINANGGDQAFPSASATIL